MIRVTRRYRFAASHRLSSPRLPEEENRRIYGKCANPYGHGHDYLLEVSARGPVDPRSGRAVDTPALDELVRDRVLKPFDHRNLNLDAPEFQGGVVPTTENLGLEIARRLGAGWKQVFPGGWPVLEKIRIVETPRNIFEVVVNP
ncbi:MAG: 6-carboxytetrahydropterin synthase [Acidobacteria bacterium]|nr:6-carboxytetrahydropterin synthase [Acidobacteriota bacterium]